MESLNASPMSTTPFTSDANGSCFTQPRNDRIQEQYQSLQGQSASHEHHNKNRPSSQSPLDQRLHQNMSQTSLRQTNIGSHRLVECVRRTWGPSEARAAQAAVARSLYGRLVFWLLSRMNESLMPPEEQMAWQKCQAAVAAMEASASSNMATKLVQLTVDCKFIML
ncbi:unnamed protein product [Protopolystoma xenopodis]|uniref:Uncharacterized protein n=1 Tax=Protopolystoma xenopodis TaxID=117903 RepID=A0A3S5FFR8_9PLAT|nr:unnamed protein product [Protopolystoma xenopodis]